MHELTLHIDYLLRYHDCVIIPGVGALIASVRSAYTKPNGVIMPPLRGIAFNAAMAHNDGMLMASYMRRSGYNAEEANRALATDIEALRGLITRGESVAIGNRGVLMADADGSIRFEAAETDGWLPELNLDTILGLTRRSHEQSKADEAVATGSRMATYLRRMKIAASIAVILALGFIVSTPTPLDNAQMASPMVEQFTPKAPTPRKLMRQPGEQSSTLLLSAVDDSDAVLTADTAAIAAYKKSLHNQAPKACLTNAFDSGRYCYVVASLNSDEEARSFIKAHNRLELRTFESDGRYRVYALSGNTIAAVKSQAAAAGIDETFPGAWVCKK